MIRSSGHLYDTARIVEEEDAEFGRACQERLKKIRKLGRKFLTCSDYLDVAKELGYRRVAQTEGAHGHEGAVGEYDRNGRLLPMPNVPVQADPNVGNGDKAGDVPDAEPIDG